MLRIKKASDTRRRKGAVALLRAACLLLGIYSSSLSSAHSEVFLAKDEALALAFPEGAEISERTVVLSQEQRSEIENRSQTTISSNLFHYFEGKRAGEVSGYAVIDSRIMRTSPAVFMVVFSPDRTVSKVVLLAFHEPSEYQPTEAWLHHLAGTIPLEDLTPGHGVPPIAGSTLSTQGLSDGVRAARASIDVVFEEKR